MATDDLVLCSTQTDAKSYSATILRVAEGYSEPVPAGVGMLGVLEASEDLLRRVRSIADASRPRRTGYGWAIVLACVALLLPMGVWGQGADKVGASDRPPALVASSPSVGAKDVDPATTELRLTFDQDMGGGFSWTGGKEHLPKTTGKPTWVDKRTCVLPVALESGKYYRVGINSTSHRNFRSATGIPTPPGVLYFVTKGADAATLAMLKTPSVVTLNPAQGAKDVPPSLTEISVTFDIPMGQGCSFTGSAENVPPGNGPIKWSEDGKTCTMPVTLEPGKQYKIGLNSPSHNNFQSASGVPLDPVKWTFTSTK